MSGFIVIEDGRAYARANWAYDVTVDAIAAALPDTELGITFRRWLLDQRCFDRETGDPICGSGLGSVDVRELSPVCREMFWSAVYDAYARCKAEGPVGWHDPQGFDGWINAFHTLIQLHESFVRGEPPESLNPHMNDVIPPTNATAGPGW